MKIECARHTDLDQIISLRYRAFEKMAPNFYSPREVKNLLGDYDKNQIAEMIEENRLFCCRQSHVVCGTAGWEKDNIRHVYVDPNQFGLGIGSKLLEHTIRDFQRRTDYDSVSAGVIIYARQFYEKCCFQVEAKKIAWDESAYYQMRRKLSSSTETNHL